MLKYLKMWYYHEVCCKRIINMKKNHAMSLSEVLVSLAVVAILAMILIPLLTKTNANKEKLLYKKAVNTMETAIAAVMQDNGVVNMSNFWPELSDSGESVRSQIGDKIITLSGVTNFGSNESSSVSKPDFRSTDGMIWWGLPDEWPTDSNGEPAKYVDIRVDVNGDGGQNLTSEDAGPYSQYDNKKPDRLKIRLMKDGRVLVPAYDDDGGDWTYEMEYLTSQKVQK